MQAQGQVGPQTVTDGTQPYLRQGRLGELVTSEMVGKYYELARRGQLFMGSMQAGAALGTALTVTAVTLTLYNPLGSTVNLALLQCAVAYTSSQVTGTTENSLVYAASLGLSTGTGPTGTTPAKIYSGLLAVGTGTQGAGQLFTAATLGATAPVIVRVFPLGKQDIVTTATAEVAQAAVDYVDGALVLGPGIAVTIQGIATTTVNGIVSMVWGEIPN